MSLIFCCDSTESSKGPCPMLPIHSLFLHLMLGGQHWSATGDISFESATILNTAYLPEGKLVFLV